MKHWYRDTVFSHIAQPYINIYYRTIISPINISIEINYLFYPQAITVWV